MIAVELVNGPSVEPVEYLQVIDHLGINEFDEENDQGSIDYIDRLIGAARQDAEDYCNRKFITQTWKFYMDVWPSENYFDLPFNPIQSVTHVKYTDTDGTVTTMTLMTDYLTDLKSQKARIVLPYLGSWPTATLHPVNPIEIQFICGYGDSSDDVPERIRQALLIQIADLYENGETIRQGAPIQRLDTVERLLGPYRIFWI